MFDSPVVVIGGAFGLLASVNAFLIAYDHGKLRRYSGRALWLKPIMRPPPLWGVSLC